MEGLNITSAIAAQKDLLLNFGGHPMAAGLSMQKDRLPEFNRRLSKTVENMLGASIHEEPELRIDAWLDLSEITPNLASALDSLAPFGPGNEKLTLATHGLTMQSSTTIGRNKEHQKLMVTDETGIPQTVLWWGGAGETLPNGKFDLAYTVRGSDWRGSPQVQMEFVDFRVIEEPMVVFKSQRPEIIDLREVSEPAKLLPGFVSNPSTLIWAESDAKKEIGGKDRNELKPANNLVVWTIPPSHSELEDALELVKPTILTLVCAHPFLEITDAFMARLTGLLKFAITHHEGEVTYTKLAAGTAQRLITVEIGLNWLVSAGKISLIGQDGDHLRIAPGKTINDLGGAARLRMEVQALLAETAAYRAHFKRANKDSLLP